jgi:hypothetical protein
VTAWYRTTEQWIIGSSAPLDLCDGGRPLTLGGEKRRAVLAILLLHANEGGFG